MPFLYPAPGASCFQRPERPVPARRPFRRAARPLCSRRRAREFPSTWKNIFKYLEKYFQVLGGFAAPHRPGFPCAPVRILLRAAAVMPPRREACLRAVWRWRARRLRRKREKSRLVFRPLGSAFFRRISVRRAVSPPRLAGLFANNAYLCTRCCACGEIGRRARLRIWCFATCRFESCQAHESKS